MQWFKKLGFSVKDIIYLFIIGGLVLFGFLKYKALMATLNDQAIAYKQLSDSLARASSEMVTKEELKAFGKNLSLDLDEIKKDLNSLGARLIGIGNTVAKIEGKIEENVGSDDEVDNGSGLPVDEDCKYCDKYGYTAMTQVKELKLGEMPFGQVLFDASKENPWTLKYDSIDIVVDTAIGKREDDKLIFYHTISTVNKSRPELSAKKFKLKVVSSTFKQTKDKISSFKLWDPYLILGMDVIVGQMYGVGPSLGLSIMSYGVNGEKQTWRFISLRGGYSSLKKPYVGVYPAEFNLGKVIPIVSDLWVGLGVIYDGQWAAGIGISTTL